MRYRVDHKLQIIIYDHLIIPVSVEYKSRPVGRDGFSGLFPFTVLQAVRCLFWLN